jgi:DHA2 family multidrug resistance protein
VNAQQSALAVVEQMVMRQASMLAYNDTWMLILLSFLVVSPAIFFLRKPRGAVGAVDAH